MPARTHGQSNLNRTPIYRAWISMRHRCNNPNASDYPYYGGRGIRVCPRWGKFELFEQDMAPHPGRGWTLDRADRDEDYEPGNCRWATRKMQSANRPTHNKLNPNLAKKIRAIYQRGVTRQVDLAIQFGCSQSLISKTIRGDIW